jgi:hypothetical protein
MPPLQVLLGQIPGPEADLLLYPVNPLTEGLFVRRGWRIIPLYVSPVIKLTESLEAALRERSRRDRGVYRKLGLTLSLMKHESDLFEFYSSMLLPTVKKRHGVHAHVSDYARLREVFQRGWLIGFYEGDKWLAGHLLEPDGKDGVRSANIAWWHGQEEIMRRHIVPACQYAVVEWADAQGFRSFNLGSCHPFVNDGVLVYKLRYNVKPELPQTTYVEAGWKARVAMWRRGTTWILRQRERFSITHQSSRSISEGRESSRGARKFPPHSSIWLPTDCLGWTCKRPSSRVRSQAAINTRNSVTSSRASTITATA